MKHREYSLTLINVLHGWSRLLLLVLPGEECPYWITRNEQEKCYSKQKVKQKASNIFKDFFFSPEGDRCFMSSSTGKPKNGLCKSGIQSSPNPSHKCIFHPHFPFSLNFSSFLQCLVLREAALTRPEQHSVEDWVTQAQLAGQLQSEDTTTSLPNSHIQTPESGEGEGKKETKYFLIPTSIRSPINGIFVSHMATIWASTLLKAHISPDRFGFLGSMEHGSPDN